jgi:hypothetical protein
LSADREKMVLSTGLFDYQENDVLVPKYLWVYVCLLAVFIAVVILWWTMARSGRGPLPMGKAKSGIRLFDDDLG